MFFTKAKWYFLFASVLRLSDFIFSAIFRLNPEVFCVLLGFSVYSADGVTEYPEVKRARHGKYLDEIFHVNNSA